MTTPLSAYTLAQPVDPECGSHMVSAAPDIHLKITVLDGWA
jgi:hypothetical protein